MIPDGITTALVHLDAPVSFIGDLGRINATIAPSAPLVWAATGTPVGNFVDNLTLSTGIDMDVVLPHTDQAGFLDGNGNTITGWYYRVTITFDKNGQRVNWPVKDFQIPSGQTMVDLALVPTGAAAPAPQVAPILPVTSIAGFNGAVTLAELGLDVISILTPDPVHPGLYLLSSAPTPVTTYDGGNAATTYTLPADSTLDGGAA